MKRIIPLLILILLLFGCSYSNDSNQDHIYGQKTISFDKIKITELTDIVNFQSITVIQNHLWIFTASDLPNRNGIGYLYIYSLDYELKATIEHNLGHLNTVSYNEENDALIVGNGGSEYGIVPLVYLYENVSTWKSKTFINFSEIDKVIIDLSVFDENKLQALWKGEMKKTNNLILITNDNAIIRLATLLEKDENDTHRRTYGQKTNYSFSAYDGRITIERVYHFDQIDVNQDSVYYNDRLYHAVGHNGLYIYSYNLENTPVERIVYYIEFNISRHGTDEIVFSNGLTIYAETLYLGYIMDGSRGIIEIQMKDIT